MRSCLLLVLLAALTPLLLAPVAGAEIWQWTDAEGVIRYTPDPDRVPASSRATLVKLAPAPGAPGESEPEYLAPAAELGVDPFNAPERARSVDVTEVPEPAWEVDAGPPDPAAAAGAAATEAAPDPESEEADGSLDDGTNTPGEADDTAQASGAAAAAVASTPPVSSPAPAETPDSPTPPVAGGTSASDASPDATETGATAMSAREATATSTETGATAVSAREATAASTGNSATASKPDEATTPTAGDSAAAETTTIATAGSGAADPWSEVAAAGATALPPSAVPAPAPLTAEQRSRRDELEELIARDEEALKRLLSDASLDETGFEQSPELREIAQRMPALQAELRKLEEGGAPEAPGTP
jgi:hypothetical protein